MKYPWMPLFWGDFLANTLDLSAQEIGAYFLLIAHAWEREAKVCVKDAQRIARVDNRHWGAVRDKLAGFFDPPDGLQGSASVVRHPRVAKELANAGELSNKRKDAAMQMHAKRRASASVLHMHPPSPSHRAGKNPEGFSPALEPARSLAPLAGSLAPSPPPQEQREVETPEQRRAIADRILKECQARGLKVKILKDHAVP